MGMISSAVTALAQTAAQLTELQRQLLQSLKEKGPGLLLELSVRVYKFPEDVQEPLRALQAAQLVTTHSISGRASGQFGAELYTLTPLGEQMLRVLAELPAPTVDSSAASAGVAATAQPQAVSVDPRQQEVDLLNKLGDTAKEKGELDQAIDFYQQALKVTRVLSSEKTGGITE